MSGEGRGMDGGKLLRTVVMAVTGVQWAIVLHDTRLGWNTTTTAAHTSACQTAYRAAHDEQAGDSAKFNSYLADFLFENINIFGIFYSVLYR